MRQLVIFVNKYSYVRFYIVWIFISGFCEQTHNLFSTFLPNIDLFSLSKLIDFNHNGQSITIFSAVRFVIRNCQCWEFQICLHLDVNHIVRTIFQQTWVDVAGSPLSPSVITPLSLFLSALGLAPEVSATSGNPLRYVSRR